MAPASAHSAAVTTGARPIQRLAEQPIATSPLPFAAIADNVVSTVRDEGPPLSNPASDDRASGARRATIKDVAREAGVSFKTVSRVMNRDGHVNAEMRAAVETAMAALGYRPHRAARALRTSRTYAIALIAGSRDEPAPGERVQFPEYLGEVIAGCTRACRSAGFHLALRHAHLTTRT